MNKLFQSYIDHLSKNPELVSQNIKWTIVTFFGWIMILSLRKTIIKGLSGENGLLEAGEAINFIIILLLPPILAHTSFYKDIPYYEWLFLGLISAYAIGGRWIFDWGLAFITKSKIESVDPELKTKVTTTTETTVK